MCQIQSDLDYARIYERVRTLKVIAEYWRKKCFSAHKTQLIFPSAPPQGPVAYALTEMPLRLEQWLKNNHLVASIVINQVFSIHAALSAKDASLVCTIQSIEFTYLETTSDRFHWFRVRSRIVSSSSVCVQRPSIQYWIHWRDQVAFFSQMSLYTKLCLPRMFLAPL